jgi:hypothetical protein
VLDNLSLALGRSSWNPSSLVRSFPSLPLSMLTGVPVPVQSSSSFCGVGGEAAIVPVQVSPIPCSGSLVMKCGLGTLASQWNICILGGGGT